MFTREEEVEAVALRKQGWSIAAIARHLGRDRKTVRNNLANEAEVGVRQRAEDPFERFVEYVKARFTEDPHLWASVLYREIKDLGFTASYQTLTREIRVRHLRPVCQACLGARPGAATIEIEHPAGIETQFDWLELPDAPWGRDASVLVAALSHSGKFRGVFSEGHTTGELIESLDSVLRRLGGTTSRWRTDRMSGVVVPGTALLTATFADVAKYYRVGVDVCPARRAKRKGVVEATNKYLTQGWWRTADVNTPAGAQQSLDRFCNRVADKRDRGQSTVEEMAAAERLKPLPSTPYPAMIEHGRGVSASALIAFDGNQYSVPPVFIGQEVMVKARLGDGSFEVVSASGGVIARHKRAPKGRGETIRTPEHRAALESLVLTGFSTDRPCRRKAHRPPGGRAKQAAAVLVGGQTPSAGFVDLSEYQRLAEVSR